MRLPRLDSRLIDIGECYSYIRALGIYNPYPIFPPFYLLLSGWMTVFGESLLSLRIPSLLASVLSVALLARLTRSRLSSAGIRAGLLFLALNPFDIYYAQYVRPYTFASCVTLLALWIVDRPGGRGRFILAFFLAGLAFLSHYSIFTAQFPLALALVFTASQEHGIPGHRMRVRRAFLVVAVAAILFYHARTILLPPHITLRTLIAGFTEFIRLLPSSYGCGRIVEVFWETIWSPFPLPGGNKPWKALLAGCALVGLTGLYRLYRSTLLSRRPIQFALATLAVAPILALYVQNGLGFTTYSASYTHTLVLALAVLVAGAYAGVSSIGRVWGILFLVVVVGGELVGLREIYTKIGRPNFPDWGGLQAAIRIHAVPGDAVLMGPEPWYGVYHSWRTTGNPAPVIAYPDRLRLFRDMNQVSPAEFDTWIRRLDRYESLWVLWDRLDYLDDSGLLRAELRTHWVETDSIALVAPPLGRDVFISRLRRTSIPSMNLEAVRSPATAR
jgi:uncharacterized membrane protein